MANKAFEQVWKSLTGMPTAQLTRYRLVKAAASPTGAAAVGITPAGAGNAAIGVAYEPNNVGEPTQVVIHGAAYCECGAAVTDGVQVMSDASGRMIAYVEAAGNVPVGIALAGGGAAGDIGTILLK